MTKRNILLALLGGLAFIQMEAHVELNSPEGGETYHPGDTMLITWTETIQHSTLNWDLYYSEDGGLTWSILKEDIPLEERSYEWIVPGIYSARGRIRIVQDNEGEDYENSSQNFTIAPVTGISEPVLSLGIKIFPNPVANHATIEFEHQETLGYTLIIYDIRGVVVQTVPDIYPGKIEIRRGSLSAGMYIVHLFDGQQVSAKGRLLIR